MSWKTKRDYRKSNKINVKKWINTTNTDHHLFHLRKYPDHAKKDNIIFHTFPWWPQSAPLLSLLGPADQCSSYGCSSYTLACDMHCSPPTAWHCWLGWVHDVAGLPFTHVSCCWSFLHPRWSCCVEWLAEWQGLEVSMESFIFQASSVAV